MPSYSLILINDDGHEIYGGGWTSSEKCAHDCTQSENVIFTLPTSVRVQDLCPVVWPDDHLITLLYSEEK